MSTQSFAFVGTYTSTGSKGIYIYRHNPATGALTPAGAISGLGNPSFLAMHPTLPVLYATNELGEYNGLKQGAVSAFAFDAAPAAGALLNSQPAHGTAPCSLVVDRTGRYVFAANYSSGSVAMFPINADGSLAPASDTAQHAGGSVNAERQEGPHAHQVALSPDNRFLYVCDLGMDKVMIYGLDMTNGKLLPNGFARLQPGAGPRHLRFHPSGRTVYVINELDNTVNVFAVEHDGGLRELQNLSTLPAGYDKVTYCADIHVTADGRFVYGSNRGHDSIAAFAVDAATGMLTALGQTSVGGNWPRNFAIGPDGARLFVANQESDDVHTLAIDPRTGTLGKAVKCVSVPKPVCIIFRSF